MKRLVVLAALLAVSLPHRAAAEAFINPFINATLTSPTGNGGGSKPGVGIAFGKTGTVGLETEIAYHPEVLSNVANALSKNKVLSFSENLLIGPTVGKVRVYGAIGGGDLYLNVTSKVATPDLASISTNYFTIDAGGGAVFSFRPRLGVRGDLRYFRAYGFNVADLGTSLSSLEHFDFWRVNIGLVVKF